MLIYHMHVLFMLESLFSFSISDCVLIEKNICWLFPDNVVLHLKKYYPCTSSKLFVKLKVSVLKDKTYFRIASYKTSKEKEALERIGHFLLLIGTNFGS